jgi:hypothetical protein
MQPEGSLPCSQERQPLIPYPEQDQSGLHHPILYIFQIQFNIIPHLRLRLLSGPFPSGFPTEIFNKVLFPPQSFT